LGLKELFGYDLKEFTNSEQMWVSKIYPEERERIQISFETSFKNRTMYHWKESYRLLKSDEDHLCLLDRETTIRDNQGKALRVLARYV
jgi:hypothetical protein